MPRRQAREPRVAYARRGRSDRLAGQAGGARRRPRRGSSRTCVAVEDWKKMVGEGARDRQRPRPPPAAGRPPTSSLEARVPRWLAADHFTFLGYRCYDLTGWRTATTRSRSCLTPGWGILREAARRKRRASRSCRRRCAPTRACQGPLYITKANSRSTVHRPGYLDYIGVKRYNDQGEVCGEHRFLGLSLDRVHVRQTVGDPAAAQKDGERHIAHRHPARRPHRQDAARHHRDLPARRVVPDRRDRDR